MELRDSSVELCQLCWKAVRKRNLCGGGAFQGNWKGEKTFPVVAVVRLKAGKKFQSRESKMKFFSS